jgi:hypothetical protein
MWRRLHCEKTGRGAVERKREHRNAGRMREARIDGREVVRVAAGHDHHLRTGGHAGGNQISIGSHAADHAKLGILLEHARHHLLEHRRQVGEQNGRERQTGNSRQETQAGIIDTPARDTMDRKGCPTA